MKRVCLVFAVLTSAAFGSQTNPENRYIVRTNDYAALSGFCAGKEIDIEPLLSVNISWSQDALDAFGDVWVLTLPQADTGSATITVIESLPGVRYVEPDAVIQIEPMEIDTTAYQSQPMPDPNDPLLSEQWGIFKTGTDKAWNAGFTGTGVKVGITDTGIDTDHEDLEYNNEMSYNFFDDNTDVEDLDGHGTRMAGIIGARMNNGKGIAGVAPNSEIWVLKMLSGGSVILISMPQAIESVLYAADNGVDVINMSWGGYSFSQTYNDAMDYAWGKGSFLVAAAGNEGTSDTLYPAGYEHVMSVGAIMEDDTRRFDSNYGETVDIFAPGSMLWTTALDGGYWRCAQTSPASAFVAGEAALICQQHPEYTNQQTWDAIINGADTITVDVGTVLRMNTAKAMGLTGVAEHPPVTPVTPVTHLNSVGREIILHYSDSPQGFHASVFDASGRRVDEIHSSQTQGALTWGGSQPTGVYFIVPQGSNSNPAKVILVR